EAQSPTVEGVTIPDALPVLPLRGGTIVYPMAVVPLLVGLTRSVRLIDDAMRRDRLIAVVAQRNEETSEAGPDDLYRVGTAAIVHQLVRGNDGSVRIVVQGLARIRLLDFVSTDPYLVARVEPYPDHILPGVETEGLRRAVVDLYRRLVGLVQG